MGHDDRRTFVGWSVLGQKGADFLLALESEASPVDVQDSFPGEERKCSLDVVRIVGIDELLGRDGVQLFRGGFGGRGRSILLVRSPAYFGEQRKQRNRSEGAATRTSTALATRFGFVSGHVTVLFHLAFRIEGRPRPLVNGSSFHPAASTGKVSQTYGPGQPEGSRLGILSEPTNAARALPIGERLDDFAPEVPAGQSNPKICAKRDHKVLHEISV